jgi:hypothetical protein
MGGGGTNHPQEIERMSLIRMQYELTRLGVDPGSVLRTAEARGITFGADNDADWRLDAIALAELHPENIAQPFALTPAERLRVFDRLARIDPARATAYRGEHAAALATATAGRDRQRRAVEELRQAHEDVAWHAEKRLREIRPQIEAETAKVEHLGSLRGALAVGTGPALDAAHSRLDAFRKEAANLEDAKAKARAAVTKLTAERVL